MRIGFASVYPWRPHVEHIDFLARLARRAGHEVFFLACDADLPDCYARELRGRPAWLECSLCRLGGIRSYEARGVSSIGQLAVASPGAAASAEWAHSSASTLGRFESDADFSGAEFAGTVARLQPAVRLAYAAAGNWIRRQRLDAVCAFNGRMDATRAIFEATRSAGIRFISVERTWFGDGLQLLPDENCLGLRSVDRLVTEWRDKPLTGEQALQAAWPVARRFLRTNSREWRAYNTNAQAVAWPVTGARRRVLLIPSSRSEVWGHPDWEPQWRSALEAYDAVMAHFGLAPSELVLRGHPNWSERIGTRSGAAAERHYAQWARQRGVHYIPSADSASTPGLIDQCDALVVANGSAALEAGFLGKQVIGIAPSAYQAAGMRDVATTPQSLQSLRLWVERDAHEHAALRREAARQTLRFLYTMAYRIAQYTRSVRAQTTTRFRYDFSADPRRFSELLATGRLQADDTGCATTPEHEEPVLDMVQARRWDALGAIPAHAAGHYRKLRRRLIYRPVDWVAQRKSLGDR